MTTTANDGAGHPPKKTEVTAPYQREHSESKFQQDTWKAFVAYNTREREKHVQSE